MRKPVSDFALCCVLLQSNGPVKHALSIFSCGVDVVLYGRVNPLRSGGKMQSRLRCRRSLVPFACAHTLTVRGDFSVGAFLTPPLTKREKEESGLLMHLYERLKL